MVNIGGVSNITYIDGKDTLIACDTGPGNALLDDFMFREMHLPFDTEGRFAAQGKSTRPGSSRRCGCRSSHRHRRSRSTGMISPGCVWRACRPPTAPRR